MSITNNEPNYIHLISDVQLKEDKIEYTRDKGTLDKYTFFLNSEDLLYKQSVTIIYVFDTNFMSDKQINCVYKGEDCLHINSCILDSIESFVFKYGNHLNPFMSHVLPMEILKKQYGKTLLKLNTIEVLKNKCILNCTFKVGSPNYVNLNNSDNKQSDFKIRPSPGSIHGIITFNLNADIFKEKYKCCYNKTKCIYNYFSTTYNMFKEIGKTYNVDTYKFILHRNSYNKNYSLICFPKTRDFVIYKIVLYASDIITKNYKIKYKITSQNLNVTSTVNNELNSNTTLIITHHKEKTLLDKDNMFINIELININPITLESNDTIIYVTTVGFIHYRNINYKGCHKYETISEYHYQSLK